MNDLIMALRNKRAEMDQQSNVGEESKTSSMGTEDRLKSMEEKIDKILKCVYSLEGKGDPNGNTNPGTNGY